MAETKAEQALRWTRETIGVGYPHWGDSRADFDYARWRDDDPSFSLAEFVSKSEESQAAWDTVNRIASERCLGSLPPELREWVSERLKGNRPRPTRRGPPDTFGRDRRLQNLVHQLSSWFGLSATRNKSRGNRCDVAAGSGCDVAGLAMNIHSYRTVEKAWNASEWHRLSYRNRGNK